MEPNPTMQNQMSWFRKNYIITTLGGLLLATPIIVGIVHGFFESTIIDWVVFLVCAGYLFLFYKRTKQSMPKTQAIPNQYWGMVCTMCGYQGRPKRQVKGSFGVELLLWFFFLIPGIIYSVWRTSGKEKVCPQCNHTTMIPASSVMGRKLIDQHAK